MIMGMMMMMMMMIMMIMRITMTMRITMSMSIALTIRMMTAKERGRKLICKDTCRHNNASNCTAIRTFLSHYLSFCLPHRLLRRHKKKNIQIFILRVRLFLA